MTRMTRLMAGGLIAGFATQGALAQDGCQCDSGPFSIDIDPFTCQGILAKCEDSDDNGKWEITISIFDTSDRTFTIESDGTGPEIESITCTTSLASGTITLIVTDPGGDEFDIGLIETVELGDGNAGRVIIQSLKCGGDAGSIEVNHLIDADVLGSVTGDVSIVADSGSDFDLQSLSVTGDLLGDVSVLSGQIEELSVTDDIGTSVDPVSIDVRDAILNIDCDNLYADITIKDGSTWKPMHRIDASATFDGSLECSTIQTLSGGVGDPELEVSTLDANVTIHGDLGEMIFVATNANADIEVNGELTGTIDINGDLAEDTLIRIEGTLNSAGSIVMGTAGLLGQIIINAVDQSHDWDGDVLIGTTTIGPNESQPDEAPYYERSDADLGGGAIGLAPFNFHPKDSVPEHDSTVTDAVPTEVKIVHYGPVHLDALANIMTVERRPISGGVWTDVSNDFDVDATTSHTGLQRDIIVEPKPGEAYEDGFMYRMQPKSGRLVCSNVDGCSDVDWDPDCYEFTIELD